MIGNRITFAAAVLILLLVQPSARAVDVVVVCPQQFENSLGPWLDHRRGEGLDVCIIGSERDAESLRDAIGEASGRSNALRAVDRRCSGLWAPL